MAASTARVDFAIEREYTPRGGSDDALDGLHFRATGRKRGQPGYDLRIIYIVPLDAAVYIHRAVLTRVGTKHPGKSARTEHGRDIELRGPAHSRFVHAGGAVAFGVPTIFDRSDTVDGLFADDSVDLVACRVTYSFDGEGPLRERMVANYEYDQGLDADEVVTL